MDDLRNVIGHGQNNDGSKWYIVSDKNKVTGKLWKAGQRVTVTPDSDCQKCEEYTCGHLDLATELETILDQELIETIKERISRVENKMVNLFEIGDEIKEQYFISNLFLNF